MRLLASGLAALAVVVIGGFLAQKLIGPDAQGATVEHVDLDSRFVPGVRQVTLVRPAGDDRVRRPLLVFLHGRGGKGEDSNLDDQFFAALHRLGDHAPAVVFPNGATASYWHRRAGGDWERYVLDEVVPLALRRLNADPRRVAIGGISMGGFGALDLARRHPGRFCAVGAHSPALWRSGGETAPGAFDDAEDFARHDVIAAARSDPAAFSAQPLWLDAGTRDPFLPGDDAFVAALRSGGVRLTAHRWPGAHEGAYWRSHWSAYLRFYSAACS